MRGLDIFKWSSIALLVKVVNWVIKGTKNAESRPLFLVQYICQVRGRVEQSELNLNRLFTNFYRIQVSGVRSLGPDVPPTSLWNFIDVTLADEDTNSMQTDNANKAIQGNVAMQVTQPGGKNCN